MRFTYLEIPGQEFNDCFVGCSIYGFCADLDLEPTIVNTSETVGGRIGQDVRV